MPEYITEQCWKSYNRGIISYEQACRVSAETWAARKDEDKFKAAIDAAERCEDDCDCANSKH